MPVTIRLSKAFYDQFGEQATNELVELFRTMDSGYRSELVESVEQLFAAYESKAELRYTRMDASIAALDGKLEASTAALDSKFETRFARLETQLERRLAEQSKWVIASWVTVMAAVIALFFKR